MDNDTMSAALVGGPVVHDGGPGAAASGDFCPSEAFVAARGDWYSAEYAAGVRAHGQWSDGLCDCLSDVPTLLCGACCGPCLVCQSMNRVGGSVPLAGSSGDGMRGGVRLNTIAFAVLCVMFLSVRYAVDFYIRATFHDAVVGLGGRDGRIRIDDEGALIDVDGEVLSEDAGEEIVAAGQHWLGTIASPLAALSGASCLWFFFIVLVLAGFKRILGVRREGGCETLWKTCCCLPCYVCQIARHVKRVQGHTIPEFVALGHAHPAHAAVEPSAPLAQPSAPLTQPSAPLAQPGSVAQRALAFPTV